MALPQYLNSVSAGEAQKEQENHARAKFPQNGHATTPKSSHRYPQRRVRQERPSKQEQQSTIALICEWVVKHQLGNHFWFKAASNVRETDFSVGIALNLLGLLFLLHALVPGANNYTQKFTSLSYYNEQTGRYALGRDDALFVCFWIILLTGLRAGVIDYVLTPLAAWAGIQKKKAKIRFAEQAWLLCHHGSFWFCGMVSIQPTRLDIAEADFGQSTSGTTRRIGSTSGLCGPAFRLVRLMAW